MKKEREREREKEPEAQLQAAPIERKEQRAILHN